MDGWMDEWMNGCPNGWYGGELEKFLNFMVLIVVIKNM